MIHVSRTGYVEQENGDLTCTITIPAESRVSALSGEPIVLGDTWGVKLQRDCAAVMFKTAGDRIEQEFEDAFKVELTVDKVQAETAAERLARKAEGNPIFKNPNQAQSIGVGGFDSASVVAAMAQGEYPWDHPAAPHMATIYRHDPFQQFALRELHAGAFAAPMESATRLITKAVKDKPMDVAIASLERVMDKYAMWASDNNLPIWPVKENQYAA